MKFPRDVPQLISPKKANKDRKAKENSEFPQLNPRSLSPSSFFNYFSYFSSEMWFEFWLYFSSSNFFRFHHSFLLKDVFKPRFVNKNELPSKQRIPLLLGSGWWNNVRISFVCWFPSLNFSEWNWRKERIKSNVLQFIWMSFIRSAPSTSLGLLLELHYSQSQVSQPSSTIKTLQFVMHINKTNQIKENERKCVFFIFITLFLVSFWEMMAAAEQAEQYKKNKSQTIRRK